MEAGAKAPGKGTRILLVEDSDTQAKLATQSLEKEGWHVTRASTCAQAMKLAKRDRFDATILDYMLPDGNGLALLDKLRAAQPGLAVLFLTGQGSEELAMEAMGRGATDFMSKDSGFHRILATRVAGVLARGDDLASAARALPAEKAPPRGKPAQRAALKPLAPAPRPETPGMDGVLDGLVHGAVTGAAVFAANGEALATRLPPAMDIGALGASLIGAEFAGQQALRQFPGAGPPTMLLVRPDALVAAASIPGPMLVVLLLAPATPASDAMRHIADAARRAWEEVDRA
jgi:CheY-like chemotaxis protein